MSAFPSPGGLRRPWAGRAGAVLSCLRLLAAGLAAGRLAAAATRLPPLRPLRPGSGVDARVSVLIPARDEAARIGACLDALAADPQVAEVIVVDDCSSDATAAVAARAGARVVRGAPCPPGWVGKPWALEQGLAAATGEWLLCLDADVRTRPGLVAALLDAAAARSLDLLSLGGRFVCGGVAEQLLHASMLATLVYRFGPPGRRRRSRPGRAIANGQCMLLRRDRLEAAGGFALAAGHMTDDVALARALAARGWRCELLDGAECFAVRMHAGVAEAWRDWGRSLPMADVTPPATSGVDLGVLWLGIVLPEIRLAVGRADRLDAILLAMRAGTTVGLAGSYSRPRHGLWLAPLADAGVAARLTWGRLRPGRRWRGRTYAPGAGRPTHGGRRESAGR